MSNEQQPLFDAIAHQWWDPNGPMKLLHTINPLRVAFIASHIKANAQTPSTTVLDIGCGAGILSEALAKEGYNVTGLDPNERLIKTAKAHARGNQHIIDYINKDTTHFLKSNPMRFDAVVCSEVLEHVDDPKQLFADAHQLCKDNGYMILSTIHQTPSAFFKAIVAAEYMFKWLPKGTHHYEKFIKPSSMASWAREKNMELVTLQGIETNPWANTATLTQHIDMQYIACFRKKA